MSGWRLRPCVDALLAIEADLRKRGTGLVLLQFNGALVDFRTAEAKPVLDLLNEVARWEHQGLRERQRVGIALARQAGRYKKPRAVHPGRGRAAAPGGR